MVRSNRSVSLHTGTPGSMKPFRGHRESMRASRLLENADYDELRAQRRALVDQDANGEYDSGRPPVQCSWCKVRRATSEATDAQFCNRCRKLRRLVAVATKAEKEHRGKKLSKVQRQELDRMNKAARDARDKLQKLKGGPQRTKLKICTRCHTLLPRSGKCGSCND